MYDAIIVGGGPAGLSAALILGRCLRRVLVLDHGRARNAYAHKLHGFLSQHDITHAEFIKKSREQISHFETVEFLDIEAVSVRSIKKHFEITTADKNVYTGHKLLIASGVVDALPKIEGFEALYGKSIFQCPYCHGWEMRNKSIAVLGEGARGVDLALMMKTWSSDVVLCTDGKYDLTAQQILQLSANHVQIEHKRIAYLEGKNGNLKCIHFKDGSERLAGALFFNTPSFIRSKLLDQLNCHYTEKEGVMTGRYETTNIPGLFVAGNITRDIQMVIEAAAEGAQAAYGINYELMNERLKVSDVLVEANV